MGYTPWCREESDMTERLTHTHTHTHSLPGLDDEGKLSSIASTPLLLLLSRFSRV